MVPLQRDCLSGPWQTGASTSSCCRSVLRRSIRRMGAKLPDLRQSARGSIPKFPNEALLLGLSVGGCGVVDSRRGSDLPGSRSEL